MKLQRAWLISLLAVLSGGCAADGVSPVPTLSGIDIRLANVTVPAGSTTQAFAILRDEQGRTYTVAGDTVSWRSSNTSVATIDPSTGLVTAVAPGTSIISAAMLSKSGSTTITVTDAPLTRAPVASISLSIQSPFYVGQTIGAVVVMKDADGNVLSGRSAVWTSADPSIANVSQIGVVTGLAPGRTTVSVTSEGITATAQVQVAADVTPTASLNVEVQPAGAVSGSAFSTQPVVQILDSEGDVNASAAIAVTASVASGNGTLSGTTTVNAVAGVATFTNLSINGTGSHVLTFSTTSPSLSVASNSFGVTPAAATQLTMTTQPSTTAQNGVVFGRQPAVQIRDGAGNAVAQSGIVVTAAVASGGGTLGGTLSATTNASGVATFTNLSLTGTAGSRTLTFSADNLTSATSSAIALAAGPPTRLVVSTQPSATVNSGAVLAQQPVIQVRDAGDNLIAQSGIVVTVTASGATLGGATTATTNADGNATFSGLTLTSSGGSATLTFSASGLTSATSSSVLVVVQGSSVPTNITITTQPSGTATDGVAFDQQPVIQLRDAANAAVAQANVTVTASILTGGGTLAGTKSVTTNASGVATFTNLSITGTPGTRTLSFAVNGLPSATSSAIAVSAGAASKLTITTQPSTSAQNTVAFARQPVVQLRDASGNAVSQSGVTVTATIATGTTGTLSNATARTDASGVATFSGLALTGQTGARTLTFAASGLTSITSSSVSITAGPATKLSMSTQPSSSVMSGTAFATQPKVQLRDVSNNTVSQSGVAVTVAINSGTGTLNGTQTVNTNSSGVATFSGLSITGNGTHVLVFTSPNLTQMTANAISVSGAATQLAITTQPSGTATSGSTFSQQPSVQLRDASGATVSTSGVSVTVAIATGGGTLGGTTTATTNSSGIATFSNLAITGTAGDRTLTFAASGLTSATSSTISVTAGTGSVGSTNEPTPSGTIVLDTRAGGAQDIQKAASFATVQGYWQASGGELSTGGGSAVMGLTTDYNGAGKHALRIDWQANPGAESAINDNSFYFPSTLSALYCSVVIHLGRTATGGGLGSVGSFVPVTSGGGMKRILWLRQRDNGTDRLYWNWPTAGQTSQQNDLTIDNRNFDTYFNANYGVGVDVRWTFELIPGNPGTLRVWRDGVLVKENTSAAIGSLGFAQLQFITTRFNATQAETEYWTDLVVWKP